MKLIDNCKSCNSKNIKYIAKNYSSGYEFDIVECKDCNLRFRNIELTNNEISVVYSDKYFTVEQKDYFFSNDELKKKIFKKRLRLVEKYSKQKAQILDIGSAVGVFLEVAKQNGWDETGIEISKLASENAIKRGLNVINSNFDILSDLNKKFEVVTLWDVVDHAEKPLKLLQNVMKVTKKDSYIFVETTVIDSLLYNISEWIFKLSLKTIKSPFLKGYPVHHSNYYSQKTMVADIEKAGFEPVAVIRECFGQELFSGSKIGKFFFSIIEKISKLINKEIVCIVVAKSCLENDKL